MLENIDNVGELLIGALVFVAFVLSVGATNNRVIEVIKLVDKVIGLPKGWQPILNSLFAIAAGSLVAVVDAFGAGAALDAMLEMSGGQWGSFADALINLLTVAVVALPASAFAEWIHEQFRGKDSGLIVSK